MDRIEYITTRRARFMGGSGPENVLWGTTVQATSGILPIWWAQRKGRGKP